MPRDEGCKKRNEATPEILSVGEGLRDGVFHLGILWTAAPVKATDRWVDCLPAIEHREKLRIEFPTWPTKVTGPLASGLTPIPCRWGEQAMEEPADQLSISTSKGR